MKTPTYEDLCAIATDYLNQAELEKSIECAHQACRSFPKFTQAYCIIGKALTLKGDYLSALETYELSWLINPLNQDSSDGVAAILSRIRNEPIPKNIDRPIPELASFGYYGKACRRFLKVKMLEAAEKAVELSKNEKSDLLLQTTIMDIDAALCKWEKFQDHILYFSKYIDPTQHLPAVSPWLSLCIQDNPEMHLRVAQKFFGDNSGHKAVITRKMRPLGKLKSRARIAYLSADFHDHATSRLIAGMLEAHSKADWEVIGLSYGPDDQSQMRTRVKNSFENFIDLKKLSTQSAAEKIKSLNLDILIDTKGLTADFESLYTLSRPSPVIVNFLAYPGSMGSSAYDYVIGDKIVTPFDHQEFYTECLVQMPNSYQPNDAYASINEKTNRLTEGLPEKSFIFAAFNNTKKITPQHFKVWMNILKNTPQSILWLYCEEETAKINLKKNAAELGISPSRIFFASHKSLPAHLERHQLADLFLDTYPCNAHTTASDALRMGLPLLTLQGNSFASRVAGSLLGAVNLNEMITHSEAEYENMAIKLYENQEILKNLKNKLIENLKNSSLYNPTLYSKNLEQAYAFMIDRSRKGKPPHAFEVRCISEGGGVRLKGGRDFKPAQLYR